MSELKTLEEIWEEANRKPVKVVGSGDEVDAPWQIIGILENTAWLVCKEDNIEASFEADRKEWKLYKEKLKVKHWPAITQHKKGQPYISGCLSHVSHPCEGCGRIAGINRRPSCSRCEYINSHLCLVLGSDEDDKIVLLCHEVFIEDFFCSRFKEKK